jgi:hypothetical protein
MTQNAWKTYEGREFVYWYQANGLYGSPDKAKKTYTVCDGYNSENGLVLIGEADDGSKEYVRLSEIGKASRPMYGQCGVYFGYAWKRSVLSVLREIFGF